MCTSAHDNTIPLPIDLKLWLICKSQAFITMTRWEHLQGLNASTSKIKLTAISLQLSEELRQMMKVALRL